MQPLVRAARSEKIFLQLAAGWCPTCRGFGETFYMPEDVDRARAKIRSPNRGSIGRKVSARFAPTAEARG